MVVTMCRTDLMTGQMIAIDSHRCFHERASLARKCARGSQRARSRSRVLGSMAVATILTMAQLKI
jgi:hypothetical protein